MKVRKRPVEVEAERIDMERWYPETPRDLPLWVQEAIDTGRVEDTEGGGLLIHTLEGRMLGDDGDYLIRGVRGELYACKPDIFAETYEVIP